MTDCHAKHGTTPPSPPLPSLTDTLPISPDAGIRPLQGANQRDTGCSSEVMLHFTLLIIVTNCNPRPQHEILFHGDSPNALFIPTPAFLSKSTRFYTKEVYCVLHTLLHYKYCHIVRECDSPSDPWGSRLSCGNTPAPRTACLWGTKVRHRLKRRKTEAKGAKYTPPPPTTTSTITKTHLSSRVTRVVHRKTTRNNKPKD